jgi:hypothetical protein
LSSKLGISIPYAVDIRSARRIPHPRHWQTLARLVGISSDSLIGLPTLPIGWKTRNRLDSRVYIKT